MKTLAGKIFGFFGCLAVLASPLQARDLDAYQQLVINKFNNYLKTDIYAALKVTRGVKDQGMFYQFALGFAKAGSVGNARNFALRMTDSTMFSKRYEIAEMLIKGKNPNNGTWILEKMPKEYQLKGLELLKETKNLNCAKGFESYINTGSYTWWRKNKK